MKKEWWNFNIKGRKVTSYVCVLEKGDRKIIKKLYFDWKNLKPITICKL